MRECENGSCNGIMGPSPIDLHVDARGRGGHISGRPAIIASWPSKRAAREGPIQATGKQRERGSGNVHQQTGLAAGAVADDDELPANLSHCDVFLLGVGVVLACVGTVEQGESWRDETTKCEQPKRGGGEIEGEEVRKKKKKRGKRKRDGRWILRKGG